MKSIEESGGKLLQNSTSDIDLRRNRIGSEDSSRQLMVGKIDAALAARSLQPSPTPSEMQLNSLTRDQRSVKMRSPTSNNLGSSRFSLRSNVFGSQSGVTLVKNRYSVVKDKQERDLERWKRKLDMQKQESSYLLRKDRSITEALERKSSMVTDLHQRKAMEFKQKNDEALARARQNESKLIAHRHAQHQHRHRVSRSSPPCSFFLQLVLTMLNAL